VTDGAVELRWVERGDPLYEEELELRFVVLREPLGHPREAVAFPFEAESLHLLAIRNGRVVGCVLFHPESPEDGRLYQMAVLPPLQRSGVGTRLVRALEGELIRRGFRSVHLHARAQVVPFYERLGYAAIGEPFEEVGIPHRNMRRALP
jgi:predicted GNAT family N-acyltransferase